MRRVRFAHHPRSWLPSALRTYAGAPSQVIPTLSATPLRHLPLPSSSPPPLPARASPFDPIFLPSRNFQLYAEAFRPDGPMKRRTLLISWISLTLLIPLAAFAAYATYGAVHHEEPRPYFASYSERGRWRCGDSISIRDNRSAYYDLQENVLLVVQQERNHSVVLSYSEVWLVDGQPPGPTLRIRRQADDLV